MVDGGRRAGEDERRMQVRPVEVDGRAGADGPPGGLEQPGRDAEADSQEGGARGRWTRARGGRPPPLPPRSRAAAASSYPLLLSPWHPRKSLRAADLPRNNIYKVDSHPLFLGDANNWKQVPLKWNNNCIVIEGKKSITGTNNSFVILIGSGVAVLV